MVVFWSRLDLPGHEWCRLREDIHEIDGTAVLNSGDAPSALSYVVRCEPGWRTREAVVSGWVGERRIDAHVRIDDHARWWLNGVRAPQVDGAIDVDLNFSPATNTLPIRRLQLPVGGSARAVAAWLRFPEFTLEPLDQIYTRRGERSWHYGSRDGSFGAELEVNEAGLVTRYGNYWKKEP